MEKIKVIKLSDFGKSMGTRELGNEIRNGVLSSLKDNSQVLFDFSNVDIISSAFADELLGKLFNELGEEVFKNKIKINNFSNEETKKLILLIINKAVTFRKTNPSLQ